VGCQIRDLDALGRAAENKGGRLKLGQHRHRAFSGGICDHAIEVVGHPEAYEVGVVRNGEVFDLAFDDWGSQGRAVTQAFGVGLVGLQNEYLAVVAEAQLRREGWMVERTEDSAQRVQLRAFA
jgi:hypothetical protein